MKPYIGIDLGTTNTVAAGVNLTEDGKFEIDILDMEQISDNAGRLTSKKTLPSCLYVDDSGKEYVGELAKKMKTLRYDRVIYNSKNYIGNRNHVWQVGGKKYTPEDVAEKVLTVVKKNIESIYNTTVDGAVITVPASFNHDQIESTKNAAKSAGFLEDQLVFISEPTAALLELIYEEKLIKQDKKRYDFSEPKKVLVFDIGGGTCDISIMNVEITDDDYKVEELAISPHTQLGGVDFDLCGVLYLLHKYSILDNVNYKAISSDEDAKRYIFSTLSLEIEKAKMMFSSETSSLIDKYNDDIVYKGSIENFYNGKPFDFEISKKEYDECIKPLLTKGGNLGFNIIDPIIDTLNKANLNKEDIDEVFLVGGMTTYSTVRRAVESFFGKKSINYLDPMYSVAKGAALYNYYNANRKRSEKGKIIIYPVVAENIYLDVKNDLPVLLVSQGTKAPYERVYDNIVKVDNATGIKLDILSGKSIYDPKMKRLKSKQLTFTDVIKPGTPISIKVTFDKNRILHLEAWVTGNDKQRIDVTFDKEVLYDGC
ncbi:Hsp70 family protein [Thermoanaerobacterium thermosaccharolyticum]|uniref:Hsp70 family protein n=1 Tax=Thermoanaerobacterium thermosaccharolyticum TaxID=1517 RepID=UPI00123A22A4|nr:Hsp70 family protein [Thermoanaerobacterium thermosaccharolyticum]KAA5808489.1 Hsp70 family protein [Thermoanaerobacterium thermosaccharolyticum]